MSVQRLKAGEARPQAPRGRVFSRALYRPARFGDAARIAVMANELATVTTGEPGRMTPAAVRRDLIDSATLGCLVAERNGVAIGYALWSAAYESAVAARGVYLSDLFVETAERGQGVARGMMRELARICAAQDGRFIWWAVTPGNTGAQAFYDSLGAISDPVEARALFEAPFRELLEG